MFKKFIKTIQQAQERRVAYWQLQHMSDSALKDIGITYHNVCEIYKQLQAKQAKDKNKNNTEEDK